MLLRKTLRTFTLAALPALVLLSWTALNQECTQVVRKNECSYPQRDLELQKEQPSRPSSDQHFQIPEIIPGSTPVQRNEMVLDEVIISPFNSPVLV